MMLCITYVPYVHEKKEQSTPYDFKEPMILKEAMCFNAREEQPTPYDF